MNVFPILCEIETLNNVEELNLSFCFKDLIVVNVFASGRRDFGEYSVYNPAKKTSAPIQS